MRAARLTTVRNPHKLEAGHDPESPHAPGLLGVMTVLDQSTNTNVSPDMTGMAVAIGRILEAQGYMQQGVDRVEKKVDTQAGTLLEHAIHLQKHDGQISAHADLLAARAPMRVTWPAVGAFILSTAALVTTIAIALLKP